MYVGHFATGLLIKALAPTVPSAPIIYGVGVLDTLNGIFTMIGMNRVQANLEAGPYLFFDLVFIDWDHSFVMAMLLSLLWGLYSLHAYDAAEPTTPFSYTGDSSIPFLAPPETEVGEIPQVFQTALVAFIASFSHWLCDLPFHNLDLAAFPYSVEHYGWGWWGRFLTGAWLIEGVFSAVCLAFAVDLFAQRGVNVKGPIAVCVGLFLSLSPWASPMYYIAQLPPPYDYLVQGASVSAGFVGPAWLIVRMLDGAERAAVTPAKKVE